MKWSDETVEALADAITKKELEQLQGLATDGFIESFEIDNRQVYLDLAQAALAAVAQSKEVEAKDAALIEARDAIESSLLGGCFKHPQIRKDMQLALNAINEVLS